MKNTYTISFIIDLVPYSAVITEDGVLIRDCAGSVLANLDNDPAVTHYHFSDEFTEAEWEDAYFSVYYAEGECEFLFYDKQTQNKADIVEEWLAAHFDAISEIGWEVLKRDRP